MNAAKMNKSIVVMAVTSLFCLGSCKDPVKSKDDQNEMNTNLNQNFTEGEELFRMHCITCHTLGYIGMQPDFPRKTWEKITDKMIRSFGAPIPDSSAKKIVDYIMTIKGQEE